MFSSGFWQFNNPRYLGSNCNPSLGFAGAASGSVNLSYPDLISLLSVSQQKYYDNMLQSNTDLSNSFNFGLYSNGMSTNMSNSQLFSTPISNSISASSNISDNFFNLMVQNELQEQLIEKSLSGIGDSYIRSNYNDYYSDGSSLIDIANSQLGKKESDGSYHKFTKGKDLEWCAAFVTWCLRKNGTPVQGDNGNQNENWDCDKLARNMLEDNPRKLAFDRSKGKFNADKIQPGAVIFFSDGHTSKNYTHVGIVEKVEDGKIYTIEGNTSDKVGKRVYNIDNKYVQTVINT